MNVDELTGIELTKAVFKCQGISIEATKEFFTSVLIPHPDINMDEAWKLVDQLEDTYYWELDGRGKIVLFTLYDKVCDKVAFQGTGDTGPEAICRAYIKACLK